MRILLIAPASDLQVLSELIAAAGGQNTPTILNGLVTHREVLSNLRSTQFDIIHFAGHGNTMQLELSDGPLSVEMFVNALGDKRPRLIVLNACRSLVPAARLHSHGADYVVGWRDDVGDNVANQFAVTFYNSLKLSDSVSSAFRTAIQLLDSTHPGVEIPVVLNGRQRALTEQVSDLQQRIDGLPTLRTLYLWAGVAIVSSTVLLWFLFR